MSDREHILFLCVANSARSQMAEGLARTMAGDGILVSSAGSSPSRVNPLAVKVLSEIGIDISAHFAKRMDSLDAEPVSKVVVLCAEENCPNFPGDVKQIFWPLPDPKTLDDFRQVRDELQGRLKELLAPRSKPRHVLSLDLEQRLELPDFQGPRWLPEDCRCKAVKVWRDPVPEDLTPYSHLILSGSTCSVLDDHPFVKPVMGLVREAVERGLPILGICYGHQFLARTLLGDSHVRRSPTPEIGWHPVEPLPDHEELFEGLPSSFYTFVSHFDEVCDLPEDWQVIARSQDCEVQGFLNRRWKLLGFQFHPEMDLEIGNACFRSDFDALTERGFDMKSVLENARDDGGGALLFPRFLEMDW
ncbi:MAG: gamma-glutamyl-gamma-aminobutyrate hydrolase family protein [Candidatus Krumholzibacteria bacterium]|nr:gamma-glutamyl-gamma-aminobutyrate hydrolase family protein [Candidatus Krumholzibacteria bacterium]MDP6798186.1 gamma-glutamyl-gamma-aminobutyrate hydrolase family protein [Candidatus Krumholzibacteria bacterium]